MLTPQEIQDKKFEKAVFGGYDMGQIDDFLDEVLSDYADLYKDNAVLKTKMRVLVEKIDEYRAVDEQMRKALYSAQVTAEKTVAEAKQEAEQLLEQAREEADRRYGHTAQRIQEEEQRLAQMQAETRKYADKIKQLLTKNIEVLDTIAGATMPVAEEAPAAPAPEIPQMPVEAPVLVTVGGVEELPPEVPQTEEEKAETADEIARTLLQTSESPAQETEDPGIMAALELGQTRVMDLELGKKAEEIMGKHGKKDESDTAKVYGDTSRTPKPRFNFSDLRFGRDYQDEDEDNQ